MFDLVLASRLEVSDFHQKIEYLIEGFIPKQLITLLYAEGGSGKSWLAYAIAKHAAGEGMEVIYLDYDNPIKVLAERELEKKLINLFSNLYYVSSSKADCTPMQIINHILDSAMKMESTFQPPLENTVILIDSLRDFFEVKVDGQALAFMSILKKLREKGATIVALSHSNKDGRNYEGSNNIYNSLDNMFQVVKIEELQDEIKYLLNIRKSRGAESCAFVLDTKSLALTPMEVEEAKLSTEDKDFIGQVKAVLADNPGLNKSELLGALGYDRRDKTASNRLDKHTGKHWISSKKKNVYTYQLS